MKTTVTKTIIEEQTLCDHCGKEAFYADVCVVCGKCACNSCSCDQLVPLRLDKFPKFWPTNACLPSFDAYACATCHNKITRRFGVVQMKTLLLNAQCERWYKWYLAQIKILNQWKYDADKKRND